MDSYSPGAETDWDHGDDWPTQRLRLGWALILFFAFEMTIGRRLPPVLAYLVLSAGIALLASAGQSIRQLRSLRRPSPIRVLDGPPDGATSDDP